MQDILQNCHARSKRWAIEVMWEQAGSLFARSDQRPHLFLSKPVQKTRSERDTQPPHFRSNQDSVLKAFMYIYYSSSELPCYLHLQRYQFFNKVLN